MDYHDLLMKMGIGSAHPGGYRATLRLLNNFFPEGNAKILELGCGTGRSACELARRGYEVTGVDVRPEMIEKGKKRAAQEKVTVHFLVADAYHPPFPSEAFDVLFIESLTVFLDVEEIISRYAELLRPKGMIFDREMMAKEDLPEPLFDEISRFYGIGFLPTPELWKKLFLQKGFSDVSIWDLQTVVEELENPAHEEADLNQMVDEDALLDPELIQKTIKNTEITLASAPYLYHGVIVGKK
ncbi:putative Uncharacterized methyltransferase YodH [[Clostridium] ultunense Esp]|nr:putative Uncharacterized methyltransferase YodH [[Clostridium] ultunense Esp]